MRKTNVKGDNILIEVKTKKSFLIMPSTAEKGKEAKNVIDIEKIIVLNIGDVAQKTMPELKIGDDVIIDFNINILPTQNLRLTGNDINENSTIYYYFIKFHNIICTVE